MTCEFVHLLHLHEFICVHFAYEIERNRKVIEYIIDEYSVCACVYVLYEVSTLASETKFRNFEISFSSFQISKIKM